MAQCNLPIDNAKSIGDDTKLKGITEMAVNMRASGVSQTPKIILNMRGYKVL